MAEATEELLKFTRGDCDPANFPHREHLRMAFEMLRRHSFTETALHFSQALRKMASRAGKPESYHETITIAFLSLVSERMGGDVTDFEHFAGQNPDLLDKGILAHWYRPERLLSNRARHTFVLPEPAI